MDRRQKKTRKAILNTFRSLLEKKRYDRITVQEIIDGADVGRSTFYSHFETKDMLLDALAGEIFHHIFESDPCPWEGDNGELEGKLSHILWHIRAERENLAGILLSDSGELFMGYFKNHLKAVFTQYIDNFTQDVPRGFLIEYLSGSFAETVRWWIKEGMKTSPEDVAKYFIGMVNQK